MRAPLPVLAIVIPCFNESETLPKTAVRMQEILSLAESEMLISEKSFVCMVNDGSIDATWQMIQACCVEHPNWQGINLSRNFGHQSALLAGLFNAEADIYVSIDADLQDDENKIIDMVRLYHEGKEIVYGCRNNRDSDSWFKKVSAGMFYQIRDALGIRTIPNHADFRLMSAKAVHELSRFEEVNLYLRGIIPMLGFPSACVYYARKERTEGESKYPLSKMLQLAWNGVVNFTDIPLECAIWCGFVGIAFSTLLIGWCIYTWYTNQSVPGWASIILIISLFGSCQLLCLGLIGLYISKLFNETKHRPRYIIESCINK